MSWLDRQSFLGADSDAVLARTRVGIVGLGGGGSHVGQQLAHVGIGQFVILDPDEIDETNLNRLVGGRAADISPATAKVDIAGRLILSVQPTAKILSKKAHWQAEGDLLKTCDVIIGGLDSVRAKDELDAFCRRFMIPYIDMGMDVLGPSGNHLIAGQVILSSPGEPCLRCFGIVTEAALDEEGRNYGAAGGKPQVVWPNGVLASSAVGLLLQLITPWHAKSAASAYLEYDGNLGTLAPSYRVKHLSGRTCPHYPANERGDPVFDIRRIDATAAPIPQIEPTAKRSRLGRLWAFIASLPATIGRRPLR